MEERPPADADAGEQDPLRSILSSQTLDSRRDGLLAARRSETSPLQETRFGKSVGMDLNGARPAAMNAAQRSGGIGPAGLRAMPGFVMWLNFIEPARQLEV